LGVDNLSAPHAGRLAEMNHNPPAGQRAYQDWMDAPYGPSIDPNPIPHIRVKFCDPNGQPVTHP
jgi:hypothetical protein